MSVSAEFEEVIPGTRRLFDESGEPLPGDELLLKHGDIVLIPQPTESPNDPLRWGLSRKIWHSGLVCFITALTAATSNVAGSAADGQNMDLGISYDVFNTGAGVLFIGIGYWTLLSSPAVHLYGRRILYLIGMLWGVIGGVWFGYSNHTSDTIWSQLFVGASESVAEATVQLSLMDLWFQHQIGTTLGLYVLATGVGTYLGPLVGSYIADSSLGWRWIGWFQAIFSAFAFVVFYFTGEETEFPRERYLINHGDRYLMDGVHVADRAAATQALTPADKTSPEPSANEDNEKVKGVSNPTNETPAELEGNRKSVSYQRPKSYWQKIAVITPAKNLRGWGLQQYATRLLHTTRVFTFPAVWYAGLQWGAQNAWLTFYLTVEQDTWYNPPYNYSDAAVGNMNIPCLIGVVIGCAYAGWGSDEFLIWMTKKYGKGVMDAEYRLWLMFLCAAIFPTGLWLFGIGSARGWAWPAPYVGLGFIGFGYGCSGDLSMAYLVDSYPDMVLEGMVGVAVVNNTMACIFSFVTSYWIDGEGVENAFVTIGVLAFVALMLTAPMMYFGKQARRWTRGRYEKFLQIRDGFGT